MDINSTVRRILASTPELKRGQVIDMGTIGFNQLCIALNIPKDAASKIVLLDSPHGCGFSFFPKP